ncbi:MAG: nucleotide exchange factor GrpE [Ignavibacteria bacterium]|jgi:molecular chaperone GrpE
MLKSKKDKIDKELEKEGKDELEEIVTGSKDETENDRTEDTDEIKAEPSVLEQPLNYEAKINELKDKFLRKAAEFENYKRRMDSELSSFYKYANENLIIELLPVLDDFDRVLNSWDKEHDAENFKKGVDLIYDKFKKVLSKQGLKEMDSKGKKFDVNLHDALLQTPSDDAEPDTVIDEIEKGYLLKDKVIRHAKVIVSSKPEGKKK